MIDMFCGSDIVVAGQRVACWSASHTVRPLIAGDYAHRTCIKLRNEIRIEMQVPNDGTEIQLTQYLVVAYWLGGRRMVVGGVMPAKCSGRPRHRYHFDRRRWSGRQVRAPAAATAGCRADAAAPSQSDVSPGGGSAYRRRRDRMPNGYTRRQGTVRWTSGLTRSGDVAMCIFDCLWLNVIRFNSLPTTHCFIQHVSVLMLIFASRRYASAIYVVCLSVRLFVTSRHCTKTAKHKITKTASYDSPGTLVFWRQRVDYSNAAVVEYLQITDSVLHIVILLTVDNR